MAGQVQHAGECYAAGRADVSRGAGGELRLALLLLRLRPAEASAEPGVWWRRKDRGPMQRLHAAGDDLPCALGARWTLTSQRQSISCALQGWSIYHIPWIVESRDAAAGTIECDVSTVCGWQADGQVGDFCRELRRQVAPDESCRGDGTSGRCGPGSRRPLLIIDRQKGKVCTSFTAASKRAGARARSDAGECDAPPPAELRVSCV